jgi:hypothetical protein
MGFFNRDGRWERFCPCLDGWETTAQHLSSPANCESSLFFPVELGRIEEGD